MCGRFTLIEDFKRIQEHFGTTADTGFRPCYNIAPSTNIPVVRLQSDTREMALCHWGLVPRWSKPDPKFRPINARAEGLFEKPFFRDSFRHRRCLVPSSGYYEWTQENGTKQPYFIHVKNTALFAFAGLWDSWQDDNATIDSCTIITTAASGDIRHLHERMPVIIPLQDYTDWLNEGGTGLLSPFEGELEYYPVSRAVNSPKNNNETLIERLNH